MKIYLLLLLSVIFYTLANAQATYMKRLSFNSDIAYVNPEDSILQLTEFSTSQYGYSYIVIDVRRSQSNLIKMDMTGNILLNILAAVHGHNYKTVIKALHTTPDGGCVFYLNHEIYSPSSLSSTAYKIDSLGNPEWSTVLPAVISPYGITDQVGYDIAILPNGYACLSKDSIYVLNSSGLLIGNMNYRGTGKLQGFSNGDIFFNGQSLRSRIDSSGFVRYSIPGLVLNYDTILYALTTDTIHLLNGMTGAYTSSVRFPPIGSNKILMMADGGWASYNSSRINRYSNNGSLRWIENVPLPTFGMNLIGEQSDGSLLTGGTYLSSRDYQYYNVDYSSFITTIDSLGHSIIDSISQVTPGDANDDGRFDIGDALYIALAQGSSGPSRYDSVLNNQIYGYLGGDIAQDFPGSFAIGLNHKQCDYEPDGVIDSLDLEHTAFVGALFKRGSNVPLRLRIPNQNASNSLLPYFSYLPDQDSAATGDTVRFHFILGDNGIAVDSIFGIAFNLGWDSLGSWDIAYGPWAYGMNSELGALPDLRIVNPRVIGLQNSLLVARRDLQNSYFVQDTIGYADIVILDSASGNIDLNMSLLSFKAITAGGFPIDFQYNTRPVHLRSLINKVPENFEEKFTMYPVPAKNKLILDQLPAKDLFIQVFNHEGKECYTTCSQNASRISINLENYSSGLYVLLLRDEEKTTTIRKFIKE